MSRRLTAGYQLCEVSQPSNVLVVFCLFVIFITCSHPLWSGPGEPADTLERESVSVHPRVACVRRGLSEKPGGCC